MQKSIDEAEDWIEKRIAQHNERQILAVHQRLDAFELRILVRPAHTTDMKILQDIGASLSDDVDAILDLGVHEPEATPVEPSKDTVLAALF